MTDGLQSIQNKGKQISENSTRSGEIIRERMLFEGPNQDISEAYYWHLNFAYYIGKGYKTLKLEDNHYFSEASQFGASIRQAKGSSIQAFQQNFQQLVQLVKTHLMPLLKEVKQADFYKEWMSQIKDCDDEIRKEEKKGDKNKDKEKIERLKKKRDEAILHMKDKWVNEVDGGMLWRMSSSATEQGLDYTLLPQLFYGASLPDPLQKEKSLKDQLDEYIYPVETTQTTRNSVAEFLYKFYTWLGPAIKETETTYRIKISSLKQFYSQLQMQINFMKPLLQEIASKSEGLEKTNFYSGFEEDHPEFASLFDYSYSSVRLLGVRGLERQGYTINDLVVSSKGVYIRGKDDIKFGKYKGKNGYITADKGDSYEFYECSQNISDEEMKNIKPIYLKKDDMKHFPVIEMLFSQKRRMETVQTQQGPQSIPYMSNEVDYRGYNWDLFEIATYRDNLKKENLDLIETFIEEIATVKDDLLYYMGELEGTGEENSVQPSSEDEKKNKESEGMVDSLKSSIGEIFLPFKGLGEMFSPLIPKRDRTSWEEKLKGEKEGSEKSNHHTTNQLKVVEDTWKVYTIFKKVHGYMQY